MPPTNQNQPNQAKGQKQQSWIFNRHFKPWQWVGVLVVAAMAMLGVLIWQSVGQPEVRHPEQEEAGLHKLTLHVKLFFVPLGEEPTLFPIRPSLPIKVSVFRIQNDKKEKSPLVEKFVAQKNQEEGIVVFELPEGNYICEAVSDKLSVRGFLNIDLHSDLEREIKLY